MFEEGSLSTILQQIYVVLVVEKYIATAAAAAAAMLVPEALPLTPFLISLDMCLLDILKVNTTVPKLKCKGEAILIMVTKLRDNA